MRRELCIIALLCAAGCQTQTHQHPTTQVAVQQQPDIELDDTASARALVFAPALAPADGDLDLDREARQATAFIGYEDLVKEYIYVHTDDRWTGDGKGDNYERRAITDRIGTLTR